MRAETKETLGRTFKSLISNQACIDGAKKDPWWIAILLFIVGIILPLVPLMVNASSADGADFINTPYHFTFDEAKVTSAFLSFDDTDTKFIVDKEDHNYLKMTVGGTEQHPTINTDDSLDPSCDTYPIYRYEVSDTFEGTPFNQYAFDVYYTERTKAEADNSIGMMIEEISLRKYKGRTTDLLEPDEELETGEFAYIPSFLILGKDFIFGSVYKTNSLTVYSQNAYTQTNWDNANFDNSDNDLVAFVLTVLDKEGSPIAKDIGNLDFQNGAYNKLKNVFSQSFLSYKWPGFWTNVGIYSAVFVGVVLFMGLLIFLLTRGKNNIFNYLKWYTCQKISWYACFTPGLFALILGFVFSNQSLMVFIMAVGLRVMWLSMKQLRPQ